LLHAFQDRDGWLTEGAMRAVAAGLRIPLADLYGTVTFYHFFRREAPGKSAPRVCDGPICKLRGAEGVLERLSDRGATPMPCAGRCDEPVPVLAGDDQFVARDDGALELRLTPRPPSRPSTHAECVFEHIRSPTRASFDGYRATGGYVGLELAARSMSAAEILTLVEASGLAGRGGAGFPTGRKWRAVAEAPGAPKTIVCNADEGEPGCFKDRVLLDHDPHAVIEGMAIAALATGATRGFLYLRYEYPHTQRVLESALASARAAGMIGQDVAGSGKPFEIHVRRGAGAYICGEETSLLNSLEGKHPFPRNRPPFPVTHGFEDLPTVVNNVETLCSVGPILSRGADWYRGLGLAPHAGTKLISLSGDVLRPGNYEVPLGLPLRTLIHEWAGGVPSGRAVLAVTMAGLSGGFLAGDDLEVTLDEPSIRSKGSFLGAGGIMVFDDSRDMLAVAADAMRFFAHESCGKCFPCRIGTQRLTERLDRRAGPSDFASWRGEVEDIGRTMKATSACGLGMAAPLVTESLLRYFGDRVAAAMSVGEA
jgi:NADH-quinone oxidoreductase subunit F